MILNSIIILFTLTYLNFKYGNFVIVIFIVYFLYKMKKLGQLEVVAFSRYVRMSPSKLRRVVDQIRYRSIPEALIILKFLALRPCSIILKLLNSAIASCKLKTNNNDISNFRIKEIRVDEGPILKRFRPHAQGRGFPIKKRMSHIISVF